MPKLIKEFEYDVDLSGIDEVGPGPFGRRRIINSSGGKFTGERLRGTIVAPSSDWLLVGQDGFGRFDARVTLKTDDGALIYVQYFGLLEMTPAILDVLAGGNTPTEFGDGYFYTSPRLETGDERYSWVNQTVFLAEGRAVPGPRAEYRVYRVANS
jgi:hypothetical protein